MFGQTELIVIAVIILILFGSAALPKFFRSLGQAKSEFQKGVDESKDQSTSSNPSQKKDIT